ncbi:MAG: hypothetical protein SFU56_14525 [Capsulimonadales bacterium]|nr:hypothetical protein [Capsulimonadales bacterium]
MESHPLSHRGKPDLLPLPGDDLLPLPGDDLLPLPGDNRPSPPPPDGLVPASDAFPTVRPVSPPGDDPAAEDGGLTITQTAGVDVSALFRPEKKPRPAAKPRARKTEEEQETGYRFPYGRTILEPTPDTTLNTFTPGTFQVRLGWQRGKNFVPLIESTPLRPFAQVTLNGQRYPVFFNQHSRKRRDRVVFGGKRKTARSARCLLRFLTFIDGREDRLSWYWRVGATAAAISYNESQRSEDSPDSPIDEITLHLPFAPGKAQILTQPEAPHVLALHLNDFVMTVAAGEVTGLREGYAPSLSHDTRGFTLTLRGADFSGPGIGATWETWFAPAKTEAEVRAALLRHAGDIADRLQRPFSGAPEERSLLRLIEENEAVLMREDLVSKRGAEKGAYHPRPGDKSFVCGAGADTALTCVALLARFYMTGNDALRRRARLVSRGVCDFQINVEESTHWGAIWEANAKKQYTDIHGEATLSVTTTARAAKGLHIAHGHFDVELLQRTALAATQWLLLKMGMDGFMPAERFEESGAPIDGPAAPWLAGELLIPFAETFRVTQNEVYIKVALRIINAIRNGLDEGSLRYEMATAEHLASAIEGILQVSREYESEAMIGLAKRLMAGLRVRRLPDGSFGESPTAVPTSMLTSTLAGCRAALAMTRVDNDPLHLLTALRAIRQAGAMARAADERGEWVPIADRTGLLLHSIGVLLATAARSPNTEADRDRVTIKRGWQTFAPDPATREFVRVKRLDDEPVDHLALVCPVSHQVLVVVVAPPDVEEVTIIKNGRTPFLRGLLDNSYDMRAGLIPLGDGKEARIGVFLADT